MESPQEIRKEKTLLVENRANEYSKRLSQEAKKRKADPKVQGEAPTDCFSPLCNKVKNMCRKICLGMCASVSDCGKGSVSETALRNLIAIYKCAQRSTGRSVGKRG